MTTATAVQPSNQTFNEARFMDNAANYGKNTKRRRLVDCIVSIGENEIDDVYAEALEVIENLKRQAEHGKGFTPDTKLGFGSDNAAVIAEKILGLSASAGKVRTMFAGLAKS